MKRSHAQKRKRSRYSSTLAPLLPEEPALGWKPSRTTTMRSVLSSTRISFHSQHTSKSAPYISIVSTHCGRHRSSYSIQKEQKDFAWKAICQKTNFALSWNWAWLVSHSWVRSGPTRNADTQRFSNVIRTHKQRPRHSTGKASVTIKRPTIMQCWANCRSSSTNTRTVFGH